MEKELLQKAIDSILHGSTQVISSTDSYGNISYSEVRINDLRVSLVEKLAEKLVQTEEYKKALDRIFTPEVVKKVLEKMVDNASWSNLPYETRQRLEREMKDTKLEARNYKLVVDVVKEHE